MKIDSTGNIVWQIFIGGDGVHRFGKVKQTSPGINFIVSGTTDNNSSKDTDILIMKFKLAGEISWFRIGFVSNEN